MRVASPLVAMLLLTAGASSAQAPDAGLKVVETGLGFRVRMPGTPERGEFSPGGDARGVEWTSEVGGATYTARSLDLPEAAGIQDPAAELADAERALAESVGGRQEPGRAVTLRGHPGRAFTLVAANGARLRTRQYLVGLRLITLMVEEPAGAASPAAEAFLGSLELTGPVAVVTKQQAAAAPLTFGQTVRGELAPGDREEFGTVSDAFAFQGRKGQHVTLTARSLGPRLYLKVRAPAGSPEFSTSLDPGESVGFARVLPADGEYFVELSSSSGDTRYGAYQVELQQGRAAWPLPRAAPRVEELPLFEARKGSVGVADPVNEHWSHFRRYRVRREAPDQLLVVRLRTRLPMAQAGLGTRLSDASGSGKSVSSGFSLEHEDGPNESTSFSHGYGDMDLFLDVTMPRGTPAAEAVEYELEVRPGKPGGEPHEWAARPGDTGGDDDASGPSSGHGAGDTYGRFLLGAGLASAADEDYFTLVNTSAFGYRVSDSVGVELAPQISYHLASESFPSFILGAGLRFGDPGGLSFGASAGPTLVVEAEEGPASVGSGVGLAGRADLLLCNDLCYGVTFTLQDVGELSVKHLSLTLGW